MEVNETMAIGLGLDIIDIPLSGKVTIASSLYIGQTNYTMKEQNVESGYWLEDNDVQPVTDEINMNIYYDKVFGTYLFTTNTEDSYTSEPREPWTKSHVNITPTYGPAGTYFTISAKMSSKSLNRVEATICHPDETTIFNLQLYDDGAHGDGSSADGYYGNTWDSSGAEEGLYYIDIVSWDESYNREEAENLATLSINSTPDKPTEVPFDTYHSANPYPSIAGQHNGTITPSSNISVSKIFTYPCAGIGGHAEYAKIYNKSWSIETVPWTGYTSDWHNLTFNNSFTLYTNETYNYTICTGSYPQIIHEPSYNATGGVITCTEFVDINGKRHEEWIPAIRLD